MERTIRIGTRKSKLALIQTNIIIQELQALEPGLSFEIVPISTVGDEMLDVPLLQFGGKGVFVDAFERALLNQEIDLAVHSAKDMPMELPEGLAIVGIPKRGDPRDVLVTLGKGLDPGRTNIIGTSSLRRQIQIEQHYPVECRSLRGNVPTRLEKLKRGEYDGIILAAAGIQRLGLMESGEFHYHYFSPEEFIPAAGQGTLAVEGRLGDDLAVLVGRITDPDTELCLRMERKIMEFLGAGCHEAIGAYARIENGSIRVNAMYEKDNSLIRVEEKALVENYSQLASIVADKLLRG